MQRTTGRTVAPSSVFLLGLILISACTGPSPSTSASSTTRPSASVKASPAPAASAPGSVRVPISDDAPDPYLEVLGRCTTAGGVLRAWSHGFTPRGTVKVSATLNDGSTDYPRLSGTFPVAADGSVRWRWSCTATPPGRYIVQFIDSGVGGTFTTTLHVAAT